MNRANPADLRRSLEIVRAFVDAGVMFIPMPVADEEEAQVRIAEVQQRLDQMEQAAEAEEGAHHE